MKTAPKAIEIVRNRSAELGASRRSPAGGNPTGIIPADITDPIPGMPLDGTIVPIPGFPAISPNIASPSGLAPRVRFALLGRRELESGSGNRLLEGLGGALSAAVAAGLATFLAPADAEAAVQGLSQFADAGGGSGIALGIGLFALGMAAWNGGAFGRSGRSSFVDPRLQRNDGFSTSSAFFKSEAGSDKTDGRFVNTVHDNGTIIAISIEGRGRAADSNPAAETARFEIEESLKNGKPLQLALPLAHTSVISPFMTKNGVLPANAPRLNTMGVALQRLPDGSGFQARFIGTGTQESVVIRLSSGQAAIFQAKEGVSSPEKPLQSGDVIVTGRLGDVMRSQDVVRDIVRQTEGQGPDVTRDAFVFEARIRAELVRLVPPGGVIETKHYKAAYQAVMQGEPPQNFKGYYESAVNRLTGRTEGYVLKANGDVVDSRGKTVDHFSADSSGFMVQVVGP